MSAAATSTPRPTLPTTAPPATRSVTTPRSGAEPRVHSVPCDEAACPPNSFCSNDYQRGGSRCHCNLGYHGNLCSE
ncbi:pikachurin isoform X2, partial [Clarias magur]